MTSMINSVIIATIRKSRREVFCPHLLLKQSGSAPLHLYILSMNSITITNAAKD